MPPWRLLVHTEAKFANYHGSLEEKRSPNNWNVPKARLIYGEAMRSGPWFFVGDAPEALRFLGMATGPLFNHCNALQRLAISCQPIFFSVGHATTPRLQGFVEMWYLLDPAAEHPPLCRAPRRRRQSPAVSTYSILAAGLRCPGVLDRCSRRTWRPV